MEKRTGVLKVVGLLVVIAMALWLNYSVFNITPLNIRAWILTFGWVAPGLFVILYTIRPLILFPASVLSLAGGLAFGAFWGTILTVIGATAGAVLSFLIARHLGKSLYQKEWQGSMKRVEQLLTSRGMFCVLLLRLTPLFPFDLISYATGLSKVKFRAFFLGTALGIIPGSFSYNFLGASFAEGKTKEILFAIALLLVLMLLSIVFKKRLAPIGTKP